MNPSTDGVALKLSYGSDFAYREAEEQLGLHYSGVGLRPSLAQGGLSNVWGAAMMPFTARDMRDWPFGPETLAPHYASVLQLTGISASHDALEKDFPLYTDSLTSLKPSSQARLVFETMERNRDRLERDGIHFGHSRLAVRGNDNVGQGGCIYCRLCMYGCPYGFIYNSSDTLEQLGRETRFSYQPGIIVQSVSETNQGVRVSGFHRLTRQSVTFECDRLFLAAGAIPTTRILLNSLAAYDHEVALKDSQYFLIPFMLLKRPHGARKESLHSLSQLFLEIFDGGKSTPVAHVQLYSNNDLINETVENVFRFLRKPLAPVVHALQDRLLVAQGFLHSEFSSQISVRLKQEKGSERLDLSAELNPAARVEVRRIVSKLLRQSRRIGAVPLSPMLKLGEPGRSFHSGGSFPMVREPRGYQTDIQGRPAGWKRVHAVDATVFPSIPATTITLSVMANAYRIASEAVKGEL
jgi:choline dehydrogenase-like flavoprotein